MLLDNEKAIIVDLNEKFPGHSKHWLPIVWAASIVTRARKEGRIRDDFAVKTIIDEINRFRGQCGLLLNYDTISVPLVYTQVSALLCSNNTICYKIYFSNLYLNIFVSCYLLLFLMKKIIHCHSNQLYKKYKTSSILDKQFNPHSNCVKVA